jgi:hypothetical protein
LDDVGSIQSWNALQAQHQCLALCQTAGLRQTKRIALVVVLCVVEEDEPQVWKKKDVVQTLMNMHEDVLQLIFGTN